MTVKVGDHLLGLRVSTPELVDLAREVLAPSLVPGVAAPPNVSVLAPPAQAGQGLLFCYRSGALVTRARSPRRALEAAVALLSSYDQAAETFVRVAAMVAVRDGRAALLSPQSRLVLDALGPKLRRAGWRLADALGADVDPGNGEVVIAGPAMAVDSAALSRLPLQQGDGRPPSPGRYPVDAWVEVAGDGREPSSLAGRVAVVAALAGDLDATAAPRTIRAVAAMLDGAVWATSPGLDPVALATSLAAATAP